MRLYVVDDPIVGLVECVAYYFECQPRFVQRAHPRIGYQRYVEAVSSSDEVHLLLDWAGIGIDEDV
jgi:hypothetical protein